MILVRTSMWFGFLLFIYAYKTDKFPPLTTVVKHFDLNHIVTNCYERSGVDKKELIEFEMSEDMEHLPNSTAIKTYLRCFGELSESLEEKSNKLLLGKMSAYFAELTKEEQEIYLGMVKGCVKRAKPIRDLLEFPYNLTVCFKRNDNQHFYIFY
ncbi:uncharacterized protein LOC119082398 [Bradysia coprophila]|uniref:uncharacterized protein LOC119082398 n=1 Tax=Bradysia coprophila TaxID=38358 RepID=UPI00187DC8B7|nr:uncharacterized protein LOC119082398 [Bradysia coprophila]